MIKDLRLIDPPMGIAGGSFKSKIFKNENSDELSVCLRNLSLADYAEKCIEHFNSMPDDMIDEICQGLIESCTEDYKLENVRDILKYCWFFELIVDIHESDSISYFVEGAGDWGKIIGIVIKNSALAYVGVDYAKYL